MWFAGGVDMVFDVVCCLDCCCGFACVEFVWVVALCLDWIYCCLLLVCLGTALGGSIAV